MARRRPRCVHCERRRPAVRSKNRRLGRVEGIHVVKRSMTEGVTYLSQRRRGGVKRMLVAQELDCQHGRVSDSNMVG
jgi:hypothetical protein